MRRIGPLGANEATLFIWDNDGAFVYWTGAANENWMDPDNWDGLAVPGTGDTVVFNGSYTNDVELAGPLSPYAIGGLIVASGYTGTRARSRWRSRWKWATSRWPAAPSTNPPPPTAPTSRSPAPRPGPTACFLTRGHVAALQPDPSHAQVRNNPVFPDHVNNRFPRILPQDPRFRSPM